jgi:uncharacterized heparinase superfamily protein
MGLLRLIKAECRARRLKRHERWEASHGDSIFGVTWSSGSLEQRSLERTAASAYARWVEAELKAAEGPPRGR